MKLPLSLLFSSVLFAAPHHRTTTQPQPEPPIPTRARVVDAGEYTVTVLNTHMNKEILISAPEGEKLSRVTLGDLHWAYSDVEKRATNIVSIRPRIHSASTTMHVITTDAKQQQHYHAFALTLKRDEPADLTVLLRYPDQPNTPAVNPEIDQLRSDIEQARKNEADALAGKQTAEAAVNDMQRALLAFKRTYPATLRVSYSLNGNKKAYREPWNLLGMVATKDQTFIFHKADTGDLPTIWAKGPDGKYLRAVAKYQPDTNTWEINRVLHDGYFSFGRRKHLKFRELRTHDE